MALTYRLNSLVLFHIRSLEVARLLVYSLRRTLLEIRPSTLTDSHSVEMSEKLLK